MATPKHAHIEKLGPGLLTIGSSPFDFSCEVKGVQITHDYDTDDPETMLCGDVVPGKSVRTDGLEADLYNDLTDAGLYAYLMTHDLDVVAFEYTPNTGTDPLTAGGAAGTASTPEKWAGQLRLQLPDSIGADEFGANIESSITWQGVGTFTFTPRTDTP